MNTTELPEMIRECVDGATQPVSFGEIRARAVMAERAGRPAPVRHRARLGVAATGVAAAGIAGALVASQSGGGPAAGTVVTAAMLRHVASASEAAMTSGQADLVTATGGSTLVQEISFDGANWNDVMNPGMPIQIHRTSNSVSWTGESINRVVDGQAYHYPSFAFKPAPHLVSEWMRITGPGAGTPLDIPDPRTLLGALSPSAGFVTDGDTTVDGASVQHLRATTPGAVPLAPLNPLIGTEPDSPQVSALDLWVDSSDVVLKAQFTVTGPDTTSELTPAGTQAVQQYINEHGITVNAELLQKLLQSPAMFTSWAQARATSDPGLASLLRQPGMVSAVHVTPGSVTVTVTFSQIGQPQDITAPANYITLGGHR